MTTAAPSPFLAQYLEIKENHPDALLFFRMGDFYELFFEDAKAAAATLDITLTARGEHDGTPIPMAGVPFHAAENYLARLIRAGHRVAICEQLERPEEAKRRGSKSIVRRGVVRVVTAGTITEDTLLSPRTGQALMAVALTAGGSEAAIASCDVSTGAFEIMNVSPEAILDAIAARPVRELVVAESEAARFPASEIDAVLTLRPDRLSSPKRGEAELKAVFGVTAIDGLGDFSRAELCACALLLDYLKLTQAGEEARLDRPQRAAGPAHLAIDPATRASLEIERDLAGGRAGSLIGCIDRTLSAPGARRLAEMIARPEIDALEINRRLDATAFFLARADISEAVADALKTLPDMERARGRLRLGRGGPRDLAAIAGGLKAGQVVAARLCEVREGVPERILQAIGALDLTRVPEVAALGLELARAIAPEPPLLARDGGFIASGYDAALDETRSLKDDSRRVIAGLQGEYADKTGVAALKVRFNNVLGYFIEVPARHGDAMMQAPLSQTFIHRQTLANAARFSTEALSQLAGRISRAEEEAKARELALFEGFVGEIDAQGEALGRITRALAEIDVALSNATWARESGAVRPEIADTPVLEAEGLRHPVVEAALRRQGKGFTANDVRLDAGGEAGPRLTVITGPNMAGKSTYLRQCALAIILAQAGCHVPARRFRLGLVDRIFSRVGASDDLSRGRSTFMVEMIETAAILNRAGPGAFVILDEVGRGTATWDGLAIAWACVEHLHNVNRCRALFATHYHELTTLAGDLPHAGNASLRAQEWKGDLVFLHEVREGAADRSYGVQVAKLAGLPRSAVKRAEQVLKRLEADPATADALPLFAAASAAGDTAEEARTPDRLRQMLDAVNPDAMSPKEALELLYRLKEET